MPLGLSLEDPDWDVWKRLYPDGLGCSAFSSPAWQRFEAGVAGEAWALQWLRVRTDSRTLTLPVLAQRDRLGRRELRFRPIHFYAGPLEASRIQAAELRQILCALCTPLVRHAHWWVPPWVDGGEEPLDVRGIGGRLAVRRPATYAIPFEGSAERHLAEHVSSTHRRQVRLNDKRGLEIVADGHDPRDIRDYFRLYEETYRERAWVGDPHPLAMFETAAKELGRGGELVLTRHKGRLVGGGVLLYDRNAVYYVQGAIERSAKAVFPHIALYWHALQQAERLGARWIDLGGVPDGNDGLARFKRAWGARAVPVQVCHWNSGPGVWAEKYIRLQGRRLLRASAALRLGSAREKRRM